MDDFRYQCRTRIIFGKGTEKLAGEETKKLGGKALLHYGSGSIKKTGLYDVIVKSLKESGINFVELPGVVPNPRLTLVREGIRLCREEKVGCVVAVGGGSVIDSAKAIAAGVRYEGDVWDFFKGKRIETALPLGVILTISAAGSEASPATVITNGEGPWKCSAKSEMIRPEFAILNPELTLSVPKSQTANGIADMMAHIFERYFTSSPSVDLTDRLCEGALRSIIRNARIVMDDPGDYHARANLMWASTMAHNGVLGTGRQEDWASHGIEHQLSAFYDVPHGAGLAVIFPAWMEYTYKRDVQRFARFAKEVWQVESHGEEAALEGIRRTRGFFRGIGLPTGLGELGIGDEKFDEMAKACVGDGFRGSFMRLYHDDIVNIYRLAKQF